MPNSESAGYLNSGPKVFLSYAHDDEAHKAVVRELAEFLTSRGITVEFDMWRTGSRQDWYAWALQAIQSAEFVIVVASPNYKLVGDGNAPSDQSRGVQAEAAVLRELVYSDREAWFGKVLPVVLPGRSITELPQFLQPYTGSHFPVSSITDEGAETLLRVLTRQPAFVPPPPGSVPVLPPYPGSSSAASSAIAVLEWTPLPHPLPVRWRTDLLRTNGTQQQEPVLEVHLVPTAVTTRVPVGRLEQLGPELAALGRAHGTFTASQELTIASSATEAAAFSAGHTNSTGIAVHRDGQRSAWGPLLQARIGWVFDRDDVSNRLAAWMTMLLAIDLAAPDVVVPVAGIDPVGWGLRLGSSADLDRDNVRIPMNLPERVHLDADESVRTAALRDATTDAAYELTARLVAALRRQ